MEHIFFVEPLLQGHLLVVDMEYVHISSSAWDVNRCLIIKKIKIIFCRSSNKESLLGMITGETLRVKMFWVNSFSPPLVLTIKTYARRPIKVLFSYIVCKPHMMNILASEIMLTCRRLFWKRVVRTRLYVYLCFHFAPK